MEYLIIAIVALLASLLTFFSGFGLGTLLLPVMALFFDVEVAVALTAVVHFLNNLFKLILIGKHIHWKTAAFFGLPAIVGAFLGAELLLQLTDMAPWATWRMGDYTYTIDPVKVIISVLIAFFALFELLPRFRAFTFPKSGLWFGGVLSGFFGGLSGHQGALRSAFLIHAGLTKEGFIATGTTIATVIDITRLLVYSSAILITHVKSEGTLLTIAVGAAFIGAFMGRQALKKITLTFVQTIVGALLLMIAVTMGLGII